MQHALKVTARRVDSRVCDVAGAHPLDVAQDKTRVDNSGVCREGQAHQPFVKKKRDSTLKAFEGPLTADGAGGLARATTSAMKMRIHKLEAFANNSRKVRRKIVETEGSLTELANGLL